MCLRSCSKWQISVSIRRNRREILYFVSLRMKMLLFNFCRVSAIIKTLRSKHFRVFFLDVEASFSSEAPSFTCWQRLQPHRETCQETCHGKSSKLDQGAGRRLATWNDSWEEKKKRNVADIPLNSSDPAAKWGLESENWQEIFCWWRNRVSAGSSCWRSWNLQMGRWWRGRL